MHHKDPHSRRGLRLTLTLALISTVTVLRAAGPPAANADTCPNAAFRTGPSERLAECRAYEQVSPTEKNGADAFSFVARFPAQASVPPPGAPDESSIAYMSFNSFANAAGGDLPPAYLSSRGADGWQTQSLAPSTSQAPPPSGAFLGYDFSADLSQVVLKVPLQALAPEAPTGVFNLYLRHPDGSYSLVTTLPPSVSLPPNCSLCGIDQPAFSGASSDFSHILFEVNESLTPGAPGGEVHNLYENFAGQLRLVGVLPDGTIAAEGATAGGGISLGYTALFHFLGQNVVHAISQDGSHVIFQAVANGGTEAEKAVGQEGNIELYDRVNGSQTIEISAPAEGATPANPTAAPAQFWAASVDGSLIFFTSSAELTTNSNTGFGNASQDLYQYNLNTRSLTDLTVDVNPADASTGAGVLGVTGASSDGSYVYFVAKGQLVSGTGVDGQPNLYVSHGGELSFIATLNEEMDANDWTSLPGTLQAYVTPDGLHLAFMSVNSLTGYDNHDRNTAQADSEVYEYSATTGQLVCASCDPSGAQPIGSAYIGASANPFEETSTPFHQPHVLSDDGSRLFFSSPDALTPGSASSQPKVFEYEGGSVHVISSGSNETGDIFLDASPGGSDVFLASRDRLVAGDQDDLVDIYDVRVDGGFPSAAAPAPCAGSACQGEPSAVLSPPTPASASFLGVGNLPAPSPVATKAKKHKAKKKHTKKKHRVRKHKIKQGRARSHHAGKGHGSR